MPRAVFLDRDDTLVDNKVATARTAHPGDLIDPALVRVLPGALEGCRRLASAGYRLVVVSNQGGVAQGICTLRQVEAVNDKVRELFRAGGVEFAGIYYSPARPSGTTERFRRHTDWRKPAPGMIAAAVAELEIDLESSWMVGDAPRDIEAGAAAGIPPPHCLLVAEGSALPDVDACAAVILGTGRAETGERGGGPCTVRLRALEGSPLADAKVAQTVKATARAIAERTGIVLLDITTEPSNVEVTLHADRLAGLGFLVELRRLTNAWYAGKHGGASLWGRAADPDGADWTGDGPAGS